MRWRRARHQVWQGVCGKTAFASWGRAARRVRRLPDPGQVYWCPPCGGHHVTGFEPGEYDRRRSLSRGQS